LREQHPGAAHVCWALLAGGQSAANKMLALQCTVPHAVEGTVRRELQHAGANLQEVAHGDVVQIAFEIVDADAATLVARLNESGQGALQWLE
jgi:hypothetical protein